MAMTPRRIRQLPTALPAKDTDVFPVSQMDDKGSATTRAMSRVQFQQDLIDVINQARQQFIDEATAEHADLHRQIDALQAQVASNQMTDQQMQAALVMLQQMVNGESGKTPYDLWLEAGNTGTMQDYLNSLVGPQGPQGQKGDKGDKGDQGPIGLTGPQGAQGPTGATGEAGPKGDKGDKGDVGATGPTGPQGPKGDTGQSGPVGATGPKGDAGPQGATGSVGPAGPKGDQGPQGIQGLKGDTGAQGPKGDAGAKGDTGATGPQGIPGAAILGEVDIVDTAVVALNLGIRSKDITVPASWGLKTTDTLFVTAATALPAGYAIDNAIPLSTTSIRIYFMGPALALLATNTLRIRVAALARS